MSRTREENAMNEMHEEERRTTRRNVFVVVTGEPNTGEDEAVPGVYVVSADGDLSDEEAAEAALDQFHEHVGIEDLDPFEIVVLDPAGTVLPRMETYDEGTLSTRAEYGGFLDDVDLPDPVREAASARQVSISR